jgi:MFS family permease
MTRRTTLFYGWIVVAVAAVVVLVTAGVRAAPGAFILSMTSEPGWSTASVWFAAAVGLVVFGLAGPLSGWLIASGRLTDRWDPRKLLLASFGFRGLSLFVLPFVHDTLTIGAFAVLSGLDYIATVPPTVALVADRFGQRNVGIVYGSVFAAHMVGAAIAAWVAASCATASGTTGRRPWRPAGSR